MVTKRPTPKRPTPKKTAEPHAPKPRARKKRASSDPTLISDLVAIGRRIPADELAKIPRDASTRFDDYMEELFV